MAEFDHGTKHRRLCDAVERELRINGQPMHYRDLAAAVFSGLGIGGEPPTRLNGVLHDDVTGRFVRTGPGRWALKSWFAVDLTRSPSEPLAAARRAESQRFEVLD